MQRIVWPDNQILREALKGDVVELLFEPHADILAWYIREIGQGHPIAEIVADAMDPNISGPDKRWKIVFKRVRRGRKDNLETQSKYSELVRAVKELERKRLTSGAPKRGLRKGVIGDVGAADRTFRRANAATRKPATK